MKIFNLFPLFYFIYTFYNMYPMDYISAIMSSIERLMI